MSQKSRGPNKTRRCVWLCWNRLDTIPKCWGSCVSILTSRGGDCPTMERTKEESGSGCRSKTAGLDRSKLASPVLLSGSEGVENAEYPSERSTNPTRARLSLMESRRFVWTWIRSKDVYANIISKDDKEFSVYDVVRAPKNEARQAQSTKNCKGGFFEVRWSESVFRPMWIVIGNHAKLRYKYATFVRNIVGKLEVNAFEAISLKKCLRKGSQSSETEVKSFVIIFTNIDIVL